MSTKNKTKKITGNIKFHETVGLSFFVERQKMKISSFQKNRLIRGVTKIFNDHFMSIIKHLKMERKKSDDKQKKTLLIILSRQQHMEKIATTFG